MTRTKQLLLVTFCDTLAGIEVSFGRTEPNGRTDGRTNGWTDRRESRNSYLDVVKCVGRICYLVIACLFQSA